MFRRFIGIAAFSALILFGAADAQAQLLRPLKSLNRLSGTWHGTGRHWRTKGPDSSWYNPWSAHNTPSWSHAGYSYPSSNRFVQPRLAPAISGQIPAFATPGPQPILGGSYEKFEQSGSSAPEQPKPREKKREEKSPSDSPILMEPIEPLQNSDGDGPNAWLD